MSHKMYPENADFAIYIHGMSLNIPLNTELATFNYLPSIPLFA